MQALRRMAGAGPAATAATAARVRQLAPPPPPRTRTRRAMASSSPALAPSSSSWSSAACPLASRRRRRLAGRPSATALPPGLGTAGAGGEPTAVDPLPKGLRIEPDPDAGAKQVTYDEASNTVKIPLTMVADEGDGGASPGRRRRTKLVMFTCKPCGHRSARMVNPVAWEKGLVFGQCQHCGAWHTLAANNPSIYEEIRFDKDAGGAGSSSDESDQTAAAGGGGKAGPDEDGPSSPI